MKIIKKYIPRHYRILALRLCIPLVILGITRLLFYLFNRQSFAEVGLGDFLAGTWFDCITIALFFLPYSILYLLPIPIRHNRYFKLFMRLMFIVTVALMAGLNLMDIEYFRYTSKRSTVDLFAILGAGSDFAQLITTFIKDFWYLILFFILFLIGVNYAYKRTGDIQPQEEQANGTFYRKNSIGFILALGIFILIGRGGWGFRPVGIIEASQYTKPSNTALVLNTPFTMLKSWGQQALQEPDYYPTIAATERYFNPVRTSEPQHLLPDGTNVVIIMLESFGNEFIGFYNGGEESYTPFLDSLLTESMTFSHGFANGKKSIEAVPAILASMPSWMDNPYISSPYSSNKVIGLPELLKQHGYESAFYHGATNGSMRFDAFAELIGFDHYFGKKEYGNEAHSDKTWGILDEYFNPWTARQISELKEPFFATLFTLSSHHPYFIPEHMRSKVKNGPQPICASLSYGDIALRKFFEEAQQQPWYDNTLFIICADHTPSSLTPLYNQRTHMYQIPIAFYHPGGKIEAGKRNQIMQQIDIYPTVLDLLNIEEAYYSFGISAYKDVDREAVGYLEGIYYYFRDNKMLTFSQNQARNLYDFTVGDNSMVDSLSYYPEKVRQYENQLKAIIQRYNHDLIRNQTTVE